jgi:hypothetical protein
MITLIFVLTCSKSLRFWSPLKRFHLVITKPRLVITTDSKLWRGRERMRVYERRRRIIWRMDLCEKIKISNERIVLDVQGCVCNGRDRLHANWGIGGNLLCKLLCQWHELQTFSDHFQQGYNINIEMMNKDKVRKIQKRKRN